MSNRRRPRKGAGVHGDACFAPQRPTENGTSALARSEISRRPMPTPASRLLHRRWPVKRTFCMTSDRTHTLRVRTPEGVAFTVRLASPVLRGTAFMIDLTAVSATWLLLSVILNLLHL